MPLETQTWVMKIDPEIKGECRIPKYEGWIELVQSPSFSFSRHWAIEEGHGPIRAAGHPQVSDIGLVKRVDFASPVIYYYTLFGKPFATVDIMGLHVDKEAVTPVLKLHMKEAAFSNTT